MTVRQKTKRRIALVVVVALGLCGAVAAMYVYRQHQYDLQAVAHRAEGMQAYEDGQYRQAMGRLSRYLRRFPDDTEVLFVYSQARLKMPIRRGEHIVQAINVLRRLLELDHTHVEAQHQLLDLYTKTGYGSEVLELAESVLAVDANSIPALRAKAVALARMRRHDQALPLVERCLAINPTDLPLHVLGLDLLAKLNRPSESIIKRAEQLRGEHPDDGRFDLIQAYAYRLANDRANTLIWLRKSADHQNLDLLSVNMLVRLLDEAQMAELSLTVLDRAMHNSSDPEVRQEAVRRLLEANRYADVVQRTESIDLNVSEFDVPLLALRAIALYQLRKPEAARPIVSALAERRKDDDGVADAWATVISAVYETPTQSAARVIDLCKAALQDDPGNAFFIFVMGDGYLHLGETELALTHWQQASTERPFWVAPRLRQAQTLLTRGQIEDALREAKLALALAPYSTEAAVVWAVTRNANLDDSQTDTPAELLRLVEVIQQVMPGEPRTFPIRIALMVRVGDKPGAINAVKSALDGGLELTQTTLMHLAQMSRDLDLGLEQACFDAVEKRFGMTADLALARAVQLIEQQDKDAARAGFSQARQASATANDLEWRVAQLRLAEALGDAQVTAQWLKLADDYPRDSRIQQMVLALREVQADAAAADRIINRLRELGGGEGVTWRLERARWLLKQDASEQNAIKAAGLLNQVIADSPSLLDARLLLATSLERMGYASRAIGELTAVAHLRPESSAIALDLARLYQSQRDFDRAREQLERVVSNSLVGPESLRRASIMLARQGADARAIEVLEKLRSIESERDDQDNQLLLAQLYRRRNQMDKAQAMCDELMKKPAPVIVAFVADFYASRNQLEKAQQVLAVLDTLELAPGQRELVTAEFLAPYGKSDQALELYRAAVLAAADNPRAHERLIRYYVQRNQIPEALAAAAEAHKQLPQDTKLAYFHQHAAVIEALGSHDRLHPLTLALLAGEPESHIASQTLKVVYDARNRNESINEVTYKLRQLADANPYFLPLQTLLAQVYLAMRQPDDAATVSARTMKAFPTAVEPAWLTAEGLAAAGRWDEALVVAEQWRQRAAAEPIGPDLLIAEAQLRIGDAKQAQGRIEPYVERALKNPDVYAQVIVRYSRTLIAAGQGDKAAAMLEPLIERSEQWREAWMQLAVLAIQQPTVAAQWMQQVSDHIPAAAVNERVTLAQHWELLSRRSKDPQYQSLARSILDEVVQHKEATASAWFSRGVIAEQSDDLEVAEQSYRMVVQLDPSIHAAKNNLAGVLVRKPQPDLQEAIRLATDAVDAMPSSANYLDTLAQVRAESHDYDKAIKCMESAIRLQPDNPKWRINLAKILAAAGRDEEADRIRRTLNTERSDAG